MILELIGLESPISLLSNLNLKVISVGIRVNKETHINGIYSEEHMGIINKVSNSTKADHLRNYVKYKFDKSVKSDRIVLQIKFSEKYSF